MTLPSGTATFLFTDVKGSTKLLREPGEPLEELVARVSPTPLLLIASGNAQRERDYNRLYAEAAREPVELWVIPDGTHTAAIRERPDEYEQQGIRFFRQALLSG
jgi:fermentation-respiration switch protein FrsA (DUF1100 family)